MPECTRSRSPGCPCSMWETGLGDVWPRCLWARRLGCSCIGISSSVLASDGAGSLDLRQRLRWPCPKTGADYLRQCAPAADTLTVHTNILMADSSCLIQLTACICRRTPSCLSAIILTSWTRLARVPPMTNVSPMHAAPTLRPHGLSGLHNARGLLLQLLYTGHSCFDLVHTSTTVRKLGWDAGAA